MNDLQRTEEWHLLRRGKITASECYLLLKNHKEPMTDREIAEHRKQNPKSRITTKEVPFSDMTFTYLDKKIAEYYMTENSFLEYVELTQLKNKAVEWGTLFEDDARKRYCEAMGVKVSDAPFIALRGYEDFAGGSPDGLIKKQNAVIEIKCPFTPNVHLRHYLYTKPEELLSDNEQYYAQCQMNMLCQERRTHKISPFCDFISYDPRISKDIQLKVLRIPKDIGYQGILLERISLAVEYYRKQMSLLNTVLQFAV